jgi:glycosyltransferase involved in cell wall biosynthesis/SAM-dependent methyltransferase
MTRVIVDCAELYLNPIRTGIQRVVREVLRHWPAGGPALHVARFEHGRGLISLPPRTVRLLADTDSDAAKLSHGELIRRLRQSVAEADAGPLPAEAVVFIPELFYDPLRCRFHEERLAARPGSLALLAYDFLPYLQPGIFRIRSAAPLMHYLRLTRLAPHVGYISEQTRQDHARRVLRGHGAERGPVLPLGADGLQLERQTWRPDRRGFVALGSLDRRKNQHLIAAAFVELWRAGHDVDLTVVGRAFEGLDLGWVAEAQCFPRFRWLDGASDEEVRQVLRTARATIYASETEGFGLPPVESLAAGIPVIAAASCPSVAMLQPAGMLRLASVTPGQISAAVASLQDDAAAAALWAEAAAIRLGTWRDFAEATVKWLDGAEFAASGLGRPVAATRSPPADALSIASNAGALAHSTLREPGDAATSDQPSQETHMDFADMFSWWNQAALDNPMTAILSNRPDWDPDAFFETGRAWLAEHRRFAALANVEIKGRRALDFGCGVGRMTAALAEYYDIAVGVDISEEMISLARRSQRRENTEFLQVTKLPLPFADKEYDCVYSTIVVQHIPFPYNLQYVKEFFRISADAVLFDAPSHLRPGMQPGPGIFMLDHRHVLICAAESGFELIGLRDFPASASRQYQYLFRRTA